MPSLLSFYQAVDIEACAIQAAVLEEVTYAKVMKTGGAQALAKGRQGVKWFANKFGMRPSIDTRPPKSTAELVMQRAEHWRKQSKSAIDQKVFSLLAERIEVPSSDLELLSTRIIEEAAAGYGISEDLLLSQQAEAISRRYMEDCIDGIREQLKKQGQEEINATDRAMAEQLARLSDEERLEIQKALNLQTLSASSLRNVIVKSGIPVAGIAAVQAGGFGAYLALATVMHAVFTSMLGITLPFAAYTTATSAMSILTGPLGVLFSLGLGVLGYFWGRRKIERSQYAMIVFTCVGHADRSLVPATHTLPSSQRYKLLTSGDAVPDVIPGEERHDYEQLLLERTSRDQATQALEVARATATAADERIATLSRRLQRAEELLASYAARQSTDASLQSALRKLVEDQSKGISSFRMELEAAKSTAEQASAKLEVQKNHTAAAECRYVSRLEKRGKELRDLWSIHYPRMEFSQQALRWSAEQDFRGRIEIERALKEMHEAADPVKLSRSRMHATGEHHSRFTLADGVECRLFYVVRNGNVEIRRMCKKKDC
ncbi:MAG TPA: hypothetical protein VN612_10070 [Acidobacteriaceae bacterium]|nr:hypothetical protein [Acidobacteriaceae bacterium]